MEFIFGNSGKGYGLLLKSNSRDEDISGHLQKIDIFNTPVSENLYAYKIITDGRTFKTIFNMFSGDTAFERGAHYNHAKWIEAGREYFLHRDFFDKMLSGFAQQGDMEQLRKGESHSFAIANAVPPARTFNKNVLLGTLHAIHAGDSKIVVALNEVDGYGFDATARGFIRAIFENLSVNLRISTSYVTSCGLDAFKDSPYRLCVVPSALQNSGTKGGMTIIGMDNNFSKVDGWADYLNWIVNLNILEKDVFFGEYENSIGKYEMGVSDSLLEYYLAQDDTQRLSKLLLNQVSKAITSGDDFTVPKRHKEKLQNHHNGVSGHILSNVDKIDIYNATDFTKKNSSQLLYLNSVYGNKPIPELETLIVNSLPKQLNEPLVDSDLQEMSVIEAAIAEYHDIARSQKNAEAMALSRVVYHLNRYFNYLLEGYKYRDKAIEGIRNSLMAFSTVNEAKSFNGSMHTSDKFRFDLTEEIEVVRNNALYKCFAIERLKSQNISIHEIAKDDLTSAFLTYTDRLKSEEDMLVARIHELSNELKNAKNEGANYRNERDAARSESAGYRRTVETLESRGRQQPSRTESVHLRDDWQPRNLLDVIEQHSRDSLLSRSIIQELDHYYRLYGWELMTDTVDELIKIIGKSEKNISRFIEVQFMDNNDLEASARLLKLLVQNQHTKEIALLHKISTARTYNDLISWIDNYINAMGKITRKNVTAYSAIYNGMKALIDERPSLYNNFNAKIPGTDKGLIRIFAIDIAGRHKSPDISPKERNRCDKIVTSYFDGNTNTGSALVKQIVIGVITVIVLGSLLFFAYKFLMPSDTEIDDYNAETYQYDVDNDYEYGYGDADYDEDLEADEDENSGTEND